MAHVNYGNPLITSFGPVSGPMKFELIGIGGRIEFRGVTISFLGDVKGPAEGTVNQFSIGLSSSTNFFQLAMPIQELVAYVAAGDLQGLMSHTLRGDDFVAFTFNPARFGGAGSDVFDSGYSGFNFGGAGSDTFRAIGPASANQVTSTDFGTVVKSAGGSIATLVGIEKIQFSDQTIDISGAAPIFDRVAAASAAVLRSPLTDFALYDAGKSGDVSSAVSALIARAEDSTLPALIVFDAIMGVAPASPQLDSLAAFVASQIQSPGYQATSNPRLGGYEAMGLGLAETQEFKTKFGAGSAQDVVRQGYQEFFGRGATEAQTQHFVGQIAYFDALYQSVGIDPASAAIKARGAAMVQMLGFAAGEATETRSDALAWLTAAAGGNAKYGQALDLM